MRILLAAALLLSAGAAPLFAADWKTLSEQSSTPALPPAWHQKEPSVEEMDKWRGPEAERLMHLATDLEGFAVEHPDDPNAVTAREKESEALFAASHLGHHGADGAIALLDRMRLSDPKLPVEMRFAIRSRQVNENARLKTRESLELGQAAYLSGGRALAQEFPTRPEPWAMLIQMADPDNLEISRELLDEVRKNSPLPESREYADAVRRRLDGLGNPLELKFTTLDGREVDLNKFRGSVILLDFWGTFSPPAVDLQRELKTLYEQYHARKLEIVGIGFDEQPSLVAAFAKEHGLSWPQECEGQGWKNDMAMRYGIRTIPALWLVDRHGILRDVKGTTNLQDKVQLLLDERE